MSCAPVDNHRTNLELKVVGTAETSFCKALADLRGFTCEQRQVCEADVQRLQSRIATVLSKDPSCAAARAPSAIAGIQRGLRDVINYTMQVTQTSTSEYTAIQSGLQAGRYPAIDRLLARKQAISKLRSLKKVSGSQSHNSDAHDTFDACCHARQLPAALAFAATAVAEPSETSDSAIYCARSAGSEHTTEVVQQLGCSQFSRSKQHIASELAHRQYVLIKAWRQRRHDAAVTVQKYVRCVLAKQLVLQLRCIRKHTGQRQQRMLITCLQMWRRHVCSFTKFRARVRERTLRYDLGQHQHLGKQFDGDSIFGSEGKAVMATKYRQWRIMAVVLTRWQTYIVRPAICFDDQLL